MKKNMIEKSLIFILRVSGIMLITAFVGVILPYNTMARIHQQIGLGEFPSLPILNYLARSVSFFYFIHGVIVLYISFNLTRYLEFLKLLCYLGFAFGIALFIIDFQSPMPPSWSWGEGSIIISLNLLVYILLIRLERKQ